MSHEPRDDTDFLQFLNGKTEDDSALIPEFYVDKKLMGAKSEEAKRPIYEDREYLRIKIKGQDKSIPVHEVTDEHRRRFPIAYAFFLRQKPVPVIGTPIEQLAGVGPSMAHHLKGLNLRTVEDLAAVSDDNTVNRIGMGGRDLVTRAKAWLQHSTSQTVALAEEKDRLREENEKLRQMLAEAQTKPAKKQKPQPAA